MNELEKKSLEYYVTKKIMLHIVLRKKDDEDPEIKPKFYNGIIIEYDDSILVIDDRKNGLTPIPLENIFSISNFREIPDFETGEKGDNDGFVYQP